MLPMRVVEGVREGTITLAFRRWEAPRVKVGGTQLTGAGVVRFESVEELLDPGELNEADAAASGFATNGYGAHSPGGYSMLSALLVEIILTAVFVWVILGVTSEKAPKGFAPLAIGLTLAGIHLVGINVTGVSVNPARSMSQAALVFTCPPASGYRGGETSAPRCSSSQLYPNVVCTRSALRQVSRASTRGCTSRRPSPGGLHRRRSDR